MIGILLVVFALLVQLSFPFALQKLHSKTLNGYISKINSPSSISFASTKSRLCATTTDPSAIGTDTWDGIDLNLSGQDSISELVDKKPIMIPHTATVLDAVKEMNNLNRGSVLIVDANNKIAGIFTERDFVSKILETERSSATTPISAVMTPATKIVVGKLTDSLNECKQLMLKNNVRHLPIVDGQDYPVGLISMREIVRAVQKSEMIRADANFFGDTLAQIQQQSRDRANLVALAEGDEGSRRDTVRGGFVIVASIVGALLLQGSWVHDHEWLSMSFTFLLGYVGIIFETYFEFNKAGIALLMSTALWVIFAGTATATGVDLSTSLGELSTKVSEVSEVIFFILGAMTIVEIVDAHQGFKVVTDVIDSKNKRGLMRVLGVLTFFMSAILDNLTTTIVMVSLIKKLLPDPEDRKLFGAMIVIAANAGGAWTPIGKTASCSY